MTRPDTPIGRWWCMRAALVATRYDGNPHRLRRLVALSCPSWPAVSPRRATRRQAQPVRGDNRDDKRHPEETPLAGKTPEFVGLSLVACRLSGDKRNPESRGSGPENRRLSPDNATRRQASPPLTGAAGWSPNPRHWEGHGPAAPNGADRAPRSCATAAGKPAVLLSMLLSPANNVRPCGPRLGTTTTTTTTRRPTGSASVTVTGTVTVAPARQPGQALPQGDTLPLGRSITATATVVRARDGPASSAFEITYETSRGEPRP